jgi:3-oxoacyl-[acyl-carrier-protein] synthase-3
LRLVSSFGNFSLGTDGKGAENLMVKSGGIKYRDKLNDLEFDESGNPISSDHLFMNGTEIFNFTIDAVPALVKDTLVKNSLSNEEIDGYVFHQANKFMINFLRKKLKINPDIFHMYMSEVGNTVSNTIPIVLTEKLKENGLKGNILLAGFGVGYSWGGCVLKFD